mgnify:CR=1 FL=1
MQKILIVEDEAAIANLIKINLEAEGYQCTCAFDGRAGADHIEQETFDLVLLDIMLPEIDGYELLEYVKPMGTPVIFLTAREAVEDEIVGFGVGADDYIRKPYNSAVLLMRIARLLKRNAEPVRTVRGLTLYLADLRVGYGEQTVELTKNEARILACLMKKDLCTRQEIVEDLWNNSCFIDENTLYVNINRLREKLRRMGADAFIRTVRGVGYRL